MPSRYPFLAPALLLAPAAALVLVGCSAKPENSPVIRRKLAELDETRSEVTELRNLLRGVSGDLTVIQDQLSNLRALSPDNEGGMQVLRKLEEMEERITRMETEATMIASAARTTTGGSSTSTTSTSSAPASSGGSTSTTTAAPSGGSSTAQRPTAPAAPSTTTTSAAPARTTPAASSTQQAAARPAPAAPAAARGRYYTLEAGDTLERIAADAGISVAEIRRANGLPEGARPLPGQRLFVPARAN